MAAQMTSKQRLLTTIRHQEPDRVPISPRYYDYLRGVEGCHCWMHYLRFAEKVGADPLFIIEPRWSNYFYHYEGRYDDLENVRVDLQIRDEGTRKLVRQVFKTPAGDLTCVHQLPSRESAITMDHMLEPLIKSRQDLEKLPFLFPKPETAFVGDALLVKDIVGERGLVEVHPTQGTDQFLVDALGVEQAFMAYYDDRPMIVELLGLFNRHHQAIMRQALEAGAEMIFDAWYNTSMSIGWSPAQFRELFVPFIRENVELVHSYGAIYDYYDDGKMDKTLEYLADAGVDVVQTLTPPPMGDVDLASAKARIGNRVCLKGNVDQVNVILRGTPAEIREAVRTAVSIGAPGGGYILSTADSIRPETPSENVDAFFAAAHEFAVTAYA
jgi:uroporphyrinogen decarboxylase